MRDPKELTLTTDETQELAATMGRKYASFLNERFFEIEAKFDGQGVYVTVLLRNDSGSFYYPVEGRIADSDHHMTRHQAGLFLLDYVDSYFEEFFRENGEVYLPIDWATFDWDGTQVQVRGQILNLELEEMADKWLNNAGSAGESLH